MDDDDDDARARSSAECSSSVTVTGEDARAYAYVAQGNAHCVFEYSGPRRELSDAYLRLRKRRKGGTNGPWRPTRVDALVWDLDEATSSWTDFDAVARREFFKRCDDNVSSSVISRFAEENEPIVVVTEDALETLVGVMSRDDKFTGECRRDGRVVSVDENFGQLSRVAAKSEYFRDAAAIYTVEIKPKSGVPIVTEDGRTTSRYRLHQKLKVARGERAEESAYDPLDLFSADETRTRRAVDALFACPQNNLRICRDGVVIFDEATRDAANARDAIAEMRDLVPKLVRNASDVFDFILTKQRLDALGYAAAHDLVTELTSGTTTITSDTIQSLRDFIVAQIAKDCAVVFTIRLDRIRPAARPPARVRVVHHPTDGADASDAPIASFEAQIIDVSGKSLSKTFDWLTLNRDILDAHSE
jgi:inositol-pentakisphosphate 2-kinase